MAYFASNIPVTPANVGAILAALNGGVGAEIVRETATTFKVKTADFTVTLIGDSFTYAEDSVEPPVPPVPPVPPNDSDDHQGRYEDDDRRWGDDHHRARCDDDGDPPTDTPPDGAPVLPFGPASGHVTGLRVSSNEGETLITAYDLDADIEELHALGTDPEAVLAYLERGSDNIHGSDEADQLSGYTGRDIIEAGDGDDVVYGNEGRDILLGEGGDDDLYGGRGADILDGGAGIDDLWGGAGRDTFVFKQGNESDTIKDFQQGRDVIQVSQYDNYAELFADTDSTGDLSYITVSADEILYIEGVTKLQLTESDFQFI